MAEIGSDPQMICIGAIAGARGVRGEVRIKSFTETPDAIADYGTVVDESGQRSFSIRITGRGSGKALGMVFARLDGINDRDVAQALKGTRLYVPRSALPEPTGDEFYHADLVGVRADLVDGGTLGVIRQVHDFGAGTVLEVDLELGGSVMVPF
ncbi:MAG TPA: 16S rRNA processing protein RimM, partial [Rhodospirillales bacterium]|nr:16S rRNA processing protein RimM [Rhodospirillales bacterium]